MPGKRLASIVLPVPGGPHSRRLCAPTAAISSARRACGWPRTSTRSGTCTSTPADTAAALAGASDSRPARCAQTASSESATRTSAPATSAASAPLPRGTITRRPSRVAWSTAGNTPCTGRSSPDSASSPTNSWSASASRGTPPFAARMPSAIGRSKRPPSLGRSAGARFTVTRRCGYSNCALRIAERTRSRASFTAASGKPTIDVPGKPPDRWTSQETSGAETPVCARV